ncbi:acetyl-CoA hydrolase/transferase family protein [Reyranella sp.]|uniref:acetyl-CoA hydrolase/transferase family protein n=1 Tax=Reyranella sp. TaxID=1929291 RepID=UPI003BAAF905
MTVHVHSIDRLDFSRHVRPGVGFVVGQAAGEPSTLTRALVGQRAALSGSTVFLGSGFSTTFQPEHGDHLRFRGIGGIGSLRRLATAGVLDPLPCHISSIAPLIARGDIACDVVLLQVSRANRQGEHSFGLIADYVRAAVARASLVVAEVNARVPWTPCETPLRSDEIDICVHTDEPLIEVPPAPFGDTERRIAAHLQAAIPERATLQMGIGAVPEAVVASLVDHRDLGIHSGMIGDSVAMLMQRGAVTNAAKGLDPGVTVTGSLIGTSMLYRFADRNRSLLLRPSSYTHSGAHLASLRRLVSINSALEVDLTGQVNAEAIGDSYLGAVGGQVDFVRAAARSPDGLSVIALPATGRRGESRIVAALSGPVTTARSDVDVVATEHGLAKLGGLTLRERIRAMVAIAAPEHRETLLAAARRHWKGA